jgi:large subunit ribosomal protein L25
MSIISLEIQARDNSGTGAARAVRRQGFIPAVVYGNDQAPVNVSVEARLIAKELKTPGILSRLYAIKVANKDERVLIRDIQFHPVSDRPVHIDFMRISKDGKVTVDVAVHLINEDKCPGLREGGIANLLHHSMQISCSPEAIPTSIDIDLSGVALGSHVYLEDVKLPEGVTVPYADYYATLVTIAAVKEEKEEEIVAEASTEGEAAPAEDAAESTEEGAEEEK